MTLVHKFTSLMGNRVGWFAGLSGGSSRTGPSHFLSYWVILTALSCLGLALRMQVNFTHSLGNYCIHCFSGQFNTYFYWASNIYHKEWPCPAHSGHVWEQWRGICVCWWGLNPMFRANTVLVCYTVSPGSRFLNGFLLGYPWEGLRRGLGYLKRVP